MPTSSCRPGGALVQELTEIEWEGIEHELLRKYDRRVVKMLGEGRFGRAYHVALSSLYQLQHNKSYEFARLLAVKYSNKPWSPQGHIKAI